MSKNEVKMDTQTGTTMSTESREDSRGAQEHAGQVWLRSARHCKRSAICIHDGGNGNADERRSVHIEEESNPSVRGTWTI